MFRKQWIAALGIWALLAAYALAAPPYKALIVDGQNGHDWKGTTPVLKKLLEETKLFTVDVATSPPKGEDMSGFKPDFAAYSVVVSNYQGDPWPEATQKAFVEYVKNGGGLVVYHFACVAFPQWKEYNEMIGLGGWGGRNEKDGRTCVGRTARSSATRALAKAAGTAPRSRSRWSSEKPTTPSPRACPRSSCTSAMNCTVGSAARGTT